MPGGAASSCAIVEGPTYTVQENNPVVDFLERVGLEQYADILMNAGFDDMETLLEIEEPL